MMTTPTCHICDHPELVDPLTNVFSFLLEPTRLRQSCSFMLKTFDHALYLEVPLRVVPSRNKDGKRRMFLPVYHPQEGLGGGLITRSRDSVAPSTPSEIPGYSFATKRRHHWRGAGKYEVKKKSSLLTQDEDPDKGQDDGEQLLLARVFNSYTADAAIAASTLRQIQLLVQVELATGLVGIEDLGEYLPSLKDEGKRAEGNDSQTTSHHRDIFLVSKQPREAATLQQVIQSDGVDISEDIICFVVGQLLNVLKALHEHKVVHRAMCPDSFSIKSTCEIFLNDLESALPLLNHHSWDDVDADDGDELRTTQACPSPEVLLQLHLNTKTDIWGVGVMMAEMFTRQPLFRARSTDRLFVEMIKILGKPDPQLLTTGEFRKARSSVKEYIAAVVSDKNEKFADPGSFVDTLPYKDVHPSDPAKDLLKWLLSFAPSERPTATEALAHPWFSSGPEGLKEHLDAAAELQDEMKQFKGQVPRGRSARATCEIASTEIERMRKQLTENEGAGTAPTFWWESAEPKEEE